MESLFVQDFLVAAVLKNKNQSKLPETKQYLLIFFDFNIISKNLNYVWLTKRN